MSTKQIVSLVVTFFVVVALIIVVAGGCWIGCWLVYRDTVLTDWKVRD